MAIFKLVPGNYGRVVFRLCLDYSVYGLNSIRKDFQPDILGYAYHYIYPRPNSLLHRRACLYVYVNVYSSAHCHGDANTPTAGCGQSNASAGSNTSRICGFDRDRWRPLERDVWRA